MVETLRQVWVQNFVVVNDALTWRENDNIPPAGCYIGSPLAPGKVERREFEYLRRGTCSFILSRDVVTGQMITPYCSPRRKEEDFLAHVQQLVATDPEATRWHT